MRGDQGESASPAAVSERRAVFHVKQYPGALLRDVFHVKQYPCAL
jgi:hypothetical protein